MRGPLFDWQWRKGRRDGGLTLSLRVPCASPISSSVFHATLVLSALARHLLLEGKAVCRDSGILVSQPSPRGEGSVSGIAASSYRSLPHWGKGAASAVDRVRSYIAYLRRCPSLSFIPLEPYPARFARHLPHAGKAMCRG